MNDYLQMAPDDVKDEFMKNLKYCTACNDNKNTCGGRDILLSDKTLTNVCQNSWYYTIINPTQEQIEWIKKFIFMRLEYIKAQ
ncbi:MAG: hypothetical protein FWC71_00625 [Defluviitaleaceae bacterium]|nr:hypothetical protein [Defluviitaleaceae bacterium]